TWVRQYTRSAHISRAMTRSFARLAWSAAAATYLLIVLGAIVRITGSGMGCGDHWPLCHGRLFPPLDELGTLIEWTHRLVAAVVSVLVAGLAGYAWSLRQRAGSPEQFNPGRGAYVALGLLIVQILLGAVTVKLSLPPWTVVLHLGTAMLLLATLLVAALGPRPAPPSRAGLRAAALGFVTVLLGALTANTGASSAWFGFPLCNGQLVPDGHCTYAKPGAPGVRGRAGVRPHRCHLRHSGGRLRSSQQRPPRLIQDLHRHFAAVTRAELDRGRVDQHGRCPPQAHRRVGV